MNRRHWNMRALVMGAMAVLPDFAQAANTGGRHEGQSAAGDAPSFGYEGRVARLRDASGAAFVRAGFPGVVLRMNFTGSGLVLDTVASTENVFIDLSVDGGAPAMVRLAPGRQRLPVFSGPAGLHRVELTRRTESWEGVWDIVGATVKGGAFLPASPLPNKRLMFIGDSITCGAGADVLRDDTRQDMSTNNARKSFGKTLAARLGAQCHLVAYGGRGVLRDWQGMRTIRNAPQFYDLALPDDPDTRWDASAWVPNAIGICLGTNDFNQGIPDQNAFVNVYQQFLEKIRRDAPLAHVFVINSPMLVDGELPKRSVCNAYLDEVVRRARNPLCTRITIRHYPGRAVNAHPIEEEHVAMAAELDPFFRKALG